MKNIKRLFVVFVLVLLVFGLCFIQQKYLEKYSQNMINGLNTLEKTCLAGDFIKAEKQAKELENEWVDYEKVLSFFFDHNEIRELGTELSGIVRLASKETEQTMLSQISSIRVEILHLWSANEVTLFSIF